MHTENNLESFVQLSISSGAETIFALPLINVFYLFIQQQYNFDISTTDCSLIGLCLIFQDNFYNPLLRNF